MKKGEQVVGDLIVYLLHKVSKCKKNQLITIALEVGFNTVTQSTKRSSKWEQAKTRTAEGRKINLEICQKLVNP